MRSGARKRGNNNAYCHDSPLSWTPWHTTKSQDLLAFVESVASLRASEPVFRRRTFLNGRLSGATDVLWLGEDGSELTPDDWRAPGRRLLGMLLEGDGIHERDAVGRRIHGHTMFVVLNSGPTDLAIVLPTRDHTEWHLVIDSTSATVREGVGLPGGSRWTVARHAAAVFRAVATTAATGSSAAAPNRP